MKTFTSLALIGTILAAITGNTKADSPAFHTARFFVDNIQSFRGSLIVPPGIPSGGTPYLWPGLQPPNNQGVLQPVLDGRNQHWYFGNAYVGNPSQPYGGGVDAGVNQNLGFYMNNIGSNNWAIGVSNGGNRADYTYNIGLAMNQAIFAVELYPGTAWDFGNLVFENVVVTALGTDPAWCTPYMNYADVTLTVEGVTSSVANDLVTCKIAKLTLAPP